MLLTVTLLTAIAGTLGIVGAIVAVETSIQRSKPQPVPVKAKASDDREECN